ncbi:MAG: class I SAM-dependent methyltransferase [Myxococcales bacterium]|nr:class I SAM-dependent methyltransferase [Myxococcales bacterium]
MKRTPEPELMNDVAQADAYAAADFAEPDAAFVGACLPWLGDIDGMVIDLGCGPGNIALRLARARPAWHVVGVDGSPAMLAHAQAAAPANAHFIQATLPERSLPRAAFSGVVSNSLLHHLHDPTVLWDSVKALGRPRARIYIADLRRPPTPAAAQALVDRYAAGAPAVLRADFLASLHAAFEPGEVEAQLVAAGLDHFEVRVTSDRHLVVRGQLPG